MSDSEQCSNWLELDLVSLLVNFSCELGQIMMTRYDFLWARWVILSNVQTEANWKVVSPDSRLGTVGIYIQYIYITKIVVLVSEPVRGRSRATELPCSIETAPLCHILQQSHHYSGRYCISKIWGRLAAKGVVLVLGVCNLNRKIPYRYLAT